MPARVDRLAAAAPVRVPASARRLTAAGFAATLLLGAIGCGDDEAPVTPAPDDPRVSLGLGTLPPIPYPPDNPPRQERIALGRLLFFDPILGGEKDVACGTCHHPDFAFADRRQFGAGVSGVGLGPSRTVSVSSITQQPVALEPRNTPTVFNTAYNGDESGLVTHEGFQFWDGRVRGLEVQATKPITSRVEMRGDAYGENAALDSVLARLREIPEYEALFANAFPEAAARGTSAIDSSTYARALAAYERELVTANSAYDRWVQGDDDALSPAQRRGVDLFFGKAKCSECHSGPMFSDFRFIVQGVPQEGTGKDVLPGDDTGREEFTLDPADRYAFRTPTLRNVELTPPYMHDGVFGTLDAVVRFYNSAALPRHPFVTDDMLEPVLRDPLGLTDDEIHDLVEFMKALTDPGTAIEPFLLTVPDRVPSGLVPVFGLGAP
jgi:cytochrome c peroxidase